MTPALRVDPRLRVLYLVAVAVGVFFLRELWQIGALLAVQGVLWIVVDLPPRRLLRQLVKLWGFALFILASYAFTAEDPSTDRWVRVEVAGVGAPVNVAGALLGVVMILRVMTVVLASQVARAGDARAIAAGLGKLGLPTLPAASIDAVLALLGGAGGLGRGGGGGGRRRRAEEAGGEPGEGFWAGLKRLGRGDVEPLIRRIEDQIARAERHAEEHGIEAHRAKEPDAIEGPADAASRAASIERRRFVVREVGVISGVALTMLGIKALKILPSIPFAPGHKLVLLTPLYVVARLLSRSRFGATLTGLAMGTAAFLLGDGRYGIFEVLKHVTPGLLCDLIVPLVLWGGRRPGAIGWSVIGGVIAVGRFATIFVVTLSVQAPAVAWAFLVPGMTVHVTFGVLSGYVTHHMVRAVLRTRETRETREAREARDAMREKEAT